MAVLSETVVSISIAAIVVAVFSAQFSSHMPMAFIWSFLNTVQIMVHVPIFSLQVPGLVFIVYE